jgi:nucleoredoxin
VDVRKILGEAPIIASDGTPLSTSALFSRRDGSAPDPATPLEKDRIVGLYFSASWCPPCRQFTPQLSGTYTHLKGHPERDLEIVFCSWDNDPRQYRDYAAHMPWARLAYQDPRVQQLSRAYDVQSIPTLILLRASDGSVVSRDARRHVPYDRMGTKYPWFDGGVVASAGGLSVGRLALFSAVALLTYSVYTSFIAGPKRRL